MLPAHYHLKKTNFLNILLVAALFQTAAIAFEEDSQKASGFIPSKQKAAVPAVTATVEPMEALSVNSQFNKVVLSKLDKHVRKSLYSKELSAEVWPKALEKQRARILSAKNLIELSESANAAIDELKSSHCRFLTTNDDTYYFLYSLFPGSKGRNHDDKGISVFPGFVTGSVGFEPDRVRYVLDDSPADRSHIMVGDKIISVNGRKYIGQSNFFNLEGRTVNIELMRKSEKRTVPIKLVKKPMYDWYTHAVSKSASKFDKGGFKLGYVHLWCGGGKAQETMQNALENPPIKDCDGLILDLRDGYGACSPDALDPFFRQPVAYPDFEITTREGEKNTSTVVFNKPMVAIINGGSRSGKEQLAYSLKKTKRALVIGDRTAGYFLAGSIQPINDKCFLYLAVFDCSLSGVRLEGVGVEPDLSVQNDKTTADDKQLETAKDELVKRIKEAKNSENKNDKALLD
ncbi:MAG: hypothetical protein IT342_25990 [Candidatus Melainabacteria bacterium]|nr:hypothetical protein [Candidatus Melainabacteria bacterium]